MKQELHAMAGARDWFYPILGIALKENVNMQSLNKTSKNSQVWKNAYRRKDWRDVCEEHVNLHASGCFKEGTDHWPMSKHMFCGRKVKY